MIHCIRVKKVMFSKLEVDIFFAFHVSCFPSFSSFSQSFCIRFIHIVEIRCNVK